MQSGDLDQLRLLTSALPAFPETISAKPGFKRHKMSCGNSFSWDLDPEANELAACAKWFNSAGTVFPQHTHDSREWIIVIEGSMFLTIEDGEEQRLLPGMSAIVEPKTPHLARFLEDCLYYAICVPRVSDWPV